MCDGVCNDVCDGMCREQNSGNAWDDIIYPGMKRAIISCLMCTQDLVEYRKVSSLHCLLCHPDMSIHAHICTFLNAYIHTGISAFIYAYMQT